MENMMTRFFAPVSQALNFLVSGRISVVLSTFSLCGRSFTPVAGLDFRDKKSRDFSGEIFLGRNYCLTTGFSGSNPRKILSHPVMS